MNKVRIGFFETNSSSTHSCIICSKKNYVKWCKGEAVYINSSSLKDIAKICDCEDYIDGDFFITEGFKKIPLSNVFEKDAYTLKKYTRDCEGLTIWDVWTLYENMMSDDPEALEYWEAPPVEIEDKRLLNTLKAFACSSNDYITTYELWDILNDSIGVTPIDKLTYGENESYIEEATIEGVDVVSVSEYGHD